MKPVAIVGVGMTPVREHWSLSIADLAEEAGRLALADAGLAGVDALYVGNAYGATYNQQTQLGSLIAGALGLGGVESFCSEAGDASGGVALRMGYLAVAAGAVKSALVLGVEKATDVVGPARNDARSISLNADYETINGATLTAMAALLMRRYMHEYEIELAQFEGFCINAHRNGSRNPKAMYRNLLRPGSFGKAPMIAEPVSLFDSAPDADGAAALVLAPADDAVDLVPKPVQLAGSAVATDTLMLQERHDPLHFASVKRSSTKALDQAGLSSGDLDLLELHDGYTIMTALALEAMGFGARGSGWAWAQDEGEKLSLDGDLPLCTFGGLKSRGNPSGATGVYQAVEAALQLRGEALDNQVAGAEAALVQNLGGLASTAVTHILRSMPE